MYQKGMAPNKEDTLVRRAIARLARLAYRWTLHMSRNFFKNDDTLRKEPSLLVAILRAILNYIENWAFKRTNSVVCRGDRPVVPTWIIPFALRSMRLSIRPARMSTAEMTPLTTNQSYENRG